MNTIRTRATTCPDAIDLGVRDVGVPLPRPPNLSAAEAVAWVQATTRRASRASDERGGVFHGALSVAGQA